MASIRNPIRRRCEWFIEQHKDVGPGVKRRLFDLVEELADEVVAAAAEPAKDLLAMRFGEVEKEIAKVLRSDQDPIENAAEAIVESHETTIRRGDAQRRKAVLKQLEEVESTCPLPWENRKVEPAMIDAA